MQSDFTERRVFARFPVKIPLGFCEPGSLALVDTQTHDISAQGICFTAYKEIPIGSSLDIYLQMPDTGEKIYIRGKVVWSSPVNHTGYELGIKLEEPPLKPIPLVLRAIKAQREY